MSDKKHTIEDLFSDSGGVDEAEIIKAIHPFVTIQKATKEIYFKDSNLSSQDKVLVYGLAKKMLKNNNLIENEAVSAIEVYQKTGIKKGTIDPIFKKLKDDGWFVGKRAYEIPNYKISSIINTINKK